MCVLQMILRRKNVRVDEWNLTSDFYKKISVLFYLQQLMDLLFHKVIG